MIRWGIDPGLDGALAIQEAAHRPPLVLPMPVVKADGRRVYDIDRLVTLIQAYRDEPQVAVIEEPRVWPALGIKSAYGLGYSCGLLYGIFRGHRVKVVLVRPAEWTRMLKVGKGKPEHIKLAQELFPSVPVRTADQADALLLLEYGWRTMGEDRRS